jgi:CheY-like chemotaxis protein
MPESNQITPFIPGLRRFARVLSGSQESGDAHIIGLLEALLAAPSQLQDADTPKIALYRQFLKLWNAAETNTFPNLSAAEAGMLRKLQTLTPKSRQAFLLLSLERFDPWEIAAILDCSASEVVRLIATADGEIASQLPPSDILIVEDGALFALHLEAIVNSLGHTVAGIASTYREAAALAEKHQPHLILSGIQLSDGSSGHDAVNQILSHFEAPVIFVTGHPKELLTGAKPEPTFIISKPFNDESVKAVISQALFFEVHSRLAAAGVEGANPADPRPAAA